MSILDYVTRLPLSHWYFQWQSSALATIQRLESYKQKYLGPSRSPTQRHTLSKKNTLLYCNSISYSNTFYAFLVFNIMKTVTAGMRWCKWLDNGITAMTSSSYVLIRAVTPCRSFVYYNKTVLYKIWSNQLLTLGFSFLNVGNIVRLVNAVLVLYVELFLFVRLL